MNSLPLPVVDLGGSDAAAAAAQLRSACTDHGFFLISNHGVPESCMQGVLAAAKVFFALPAEAKAALHHDKHAKGYQPWGQQTLDYAAQATGDTKESWALMDAGLSAPEDGQPFVSPNQWPPQQLLPRFRSEIEQFVAHMKVLRDRLNRLMAQALGQPPDFFDDAFCSRPPLDMLRLFHYHCPHGSSAGEGRFGAGAHSDWGHITYLMADGPGLEVFYQGSWHSVPNMAGTFVCNICDLLQLWSGGLFKATKHRVMVEPGRHRYSCAYFTVPAWDTWVMPLATSGAGSTTAAAEVKAGAGEMEAAAANQGANQGLAAAVAAESSEEGAASGLVVLDSGEMLLGAPGVRVLDYITAKYQLHVVGAGRRTQKNSA